MGSLPRVDVAIATTRGGRATTWAVLATWAWGGRAIALVTWSLVCVKSR